MKITHIQRMCMHDGPGIRTTVFFKGCNLRCPWCCNPENISFNTENYVDSDGSIGVYGKNYTCEELFYELLKDEFFFKNTDGGVTFSGGEALLQLWKVQMLLKKIKERGIHVAVETALQIPIYCLKAVTDYVDLFMVDIKILDNNLCRQVLNGNVKFYKNNLKLLKEKGKNVLFRIPCNKEYTATSENLDLIIKLLVEYPEYEVEIFKIHNLGKAKYESLQKNFLKFKDIEDEEMLEIKQYIESRINNTVKICKI